jgi:hypothetical protein
MPPELHNNNNRRKSVFFTYKRLLKFKNRRLKLIYLSENVLLTKDFFNLSGSRDDRKSDVSLQKRKSPGWVFNPHFILALLVWPSELN